MGNFKVKVNTPEESKEVQDLFEVIGYKKGACSLGNYPAIIVTTQDWATGDYCSTRALGLDIPAHDKCKELALPELRDMVVLKRNDVNDATHQDKDDAEFKYRLIDNHWHVITEGNPAWRKSSVTLEESPLFIKPIEKTMNTLNTEQHEQPSLNDQYAEIEQVRQAIKVQDGNDSDHAADAMSYGFMGIKQDSVKNPQHYNKGGVECIDAIEASMTPEAFKGYLKGNVQKYMWRYEQKGGVESLRKAQWYLERLVASMGS